MELALIIIILICSVFNMLMLMDNHEEPRIEQRISSNNKLQHEINDLYVKFNSLEDVLRYNQYQQHHDDETEVLRSLREVTEDMQERLTILEESFKYHIQSTAEFNSKQK